MATQRLAGLSPVWAAGGLQTHESRQSSLTIEWTIAKQVRPDTNVIILICEDECPPTFEYVTYAFPIFSEAGEFPVVILCIL